MWFDIWQQIQSCMFFWLSPVGKKQQQKKTVEGSAQRFPQINDVVPWGSIDEDGCDLLTFVKICFCACVSLCVCVFVHSSAWPLLRLPPSLWINAVSFFDHFHRNSLQKHQINFSECFEQKTVICASGWQLGSTCQSMFFKVKHSLIVYNITCQKTSTNTPKHPTGTRPALNWYECQNSAQEKYAAISSNIAVL